jgi:uncharacterized OB-fold protein
MSEDSYPTPEEQRYRLIGVECSRCGAKLFPPRPVCPYCEGQQQRPVKTKPPEA